MLHSKFWHFIFLYIYSNFHKLSHNSRQHFLFIYVSFSVFILIVVIGVYNIRKWRRSRQMMEENQPLSDKGEPVYRGFWTCDQPFIWQEGTSLLWILTCDIVLFSIHNSICQNCQCLMCCRCLHSQHILQVSSNISLSLEYF